MNKFFRKYESKIKTAMFVAMMIIPFLLYHGAIGGHEVMVGILMILLCAVMLVTIKVG